MVEEDSTPVRGKEELGTIITHRRNIGGLMALALVLDLALITMIPGFESIPHGIDIISINLFIGTVGLIVLTWYAVCWSLLSRLLPVMMLIGETRILPDKKVAIARRGNVHALLKWGQATIMLLAFRQPIRSFDETINVSRGFLRWEFKIGIGDIRIARREGVYSIPIDDHEYIRGEAVLYGIPTENPGLLRYGISYTQEQIDAIIDRLLDEVPSARTVSEW